MRPLRAGLLGLALSYALLALAYLIGAPVGPTLIIVASIGAFVAIYWLQREPLTPRHRKYILAAFLTALVGSILSRGVARNASGSADWRLALSMLAAALGVASYVATAALVAWPVATRRQQRAWWAVGSLAGGACAYFIAAALSAGSGTSAQTDALAAFAWTQAGSIAAAAAMLGWLAARPTALPVMRLGPSAGLFGGFMGNQPPTPSFLKPTGGAKPAKRRMGRVQPLGASPASAAPTEGPSKEERLGALEERFKRGEMDEWTYLDKRQEIEGK